ncbi:asparagine synthase (glutamine-hydrolyzing) [Lactimicrobium massiliense]|uniref:asparagine synthase (glutamine-hydrolyzing) n=1 Tax=Lactimicrobium massiliense TaxID=2161814 RepID=UPI000D55F2C4|nr:asparagine synthase (glutamine-hydrolyzing) [Lactimicrobium massiliense]
MCGICGIYNFENDKAFDPGIIDHMLAKLKHRGPDGQNSWHDRRISLGFTRLSFIDLKGGMQPLFNEDCSIATIVNGEIFNYQELKADLIRKGHSFRTKTDTEVVAHLYEEYGLDFPIHINGQFAIALYDAKKNMLVLIRDQFGICPLFYTIKDGRIIFGSEIKAILEYPGMPRILNMKAVDQLMNFPGIVAPVTFFKGINALEAGKMMIFQAGKEPEKKTYYEMLYHPVTEDLGLDYYVSHLKELLVKAISRRLIADVPIGFYVSGGLDSSIVACYIGKFLLNSYYSFSAEIGEGDLDESNFQAMVKECVKSKHYSTVINDEVIWKCLPDVIYHTETAVKESYDTAAYMLSSLVQASPAKAVLTGQGSDELFCGYIGYLIDKFRNMNKEAISPDEQELNARLWGDPNFRFERDHLAEREIQTKIYSQDIVANLPQFSALQESPINLDAVKNVTTQQRRSYIDFHLRLQDHLLIEHGDHMTFAHSVEGRHPFLDPELVSFVMTIPDKYKLHGTNEKYILKKAGIGIVPDPILKRKKFPFQAPGMSSMIKHPSENNYLDDALIRKYGIFDPEYVSHMKEVYASDDFKLMGAYKIDYLMIVLTVTMLCETYQMKIEI